MLTLGILIVSLLGFGFVQYVNHGWQYVQVSVFSDLTTHDITIAFTISFTIYFYQAFQIIPCILLWIFQKWIPESPKWLVRQNRYRIPQVFVTGHYI